MGANGEASQFTVFGADGFIGGHLVRHLRAAGHSVLTVVRDRFPPARARLGHVIYAIGLTGDFKARLKETADAHIIVLREVMRAYRWSSLAYLSSTRVYGITGYTDEESAIAVKPANEDDFYNITKLAGEALCLTDTHPAARVVRLSNVVGPGDAPINFLPSLVDDARKRGHVTFHSSPMSQRDYIDVSDVVRLVEAVALKGRHRTYNIAAGENTTNATVADLLQRHFGATVTFDESALTIRRRPIHTHRVADEFRFVARPFGRSFLDAFAPSSTREQQS